MKRYVPVLRQRPHDDWESRNADTNDRDEAVSQARFWVSCGWEAQVWDVSGGVVFDSTAPPLPTIAFCGYGRAGKDTAGKYVGEKTPLRYIGSLSWVGKGVVAEALGLCEQEAWETRHARRAEWKQILNDYRRDDPTKLIRDSLALGEIVVGVRGDVELAAARERGLIKCAVWVDNPRVEKDFTTDYGPADCDRVVRNDGTLEEFHARLDALVSELKIPLRS